MAKLASKLAASKLGPVADENTLAIFLYYIYIFNILKYHGVKPFQIYVSFRYLEAFP